MTGVGPRIQLAAVGAQDAPLTIGVLPDASGTTNWLTYAPFALTDCALTFDAPITFGTSGTITVPYSMTDVVGTSYLCVNLPVVPGNSWCRDVGYQMIQRCQVIVGNSAIDDATGLQYLVQDMLGLTDSQKKTVAALTGSEGFTSETPQSVLVPLRFFFCRLGGSGLPLAAMTNSKLQIILTLAPISDLLLTSAQPTTLPDLQASILMETAILSPEEKTFFMYKPLDLLIERVFTQQYSTSQITNNHDVLLVPSLSVDLTFAQGAVKQIAFVFTDDSTGRLVPALQNCSLFVNNVQQGDTRTGDRFLLPTAFQACQACVLKPVYTINFALQTGPLQPSGVLDMQHLSSCFLQLQINATIPLTLHVFATAYATLHFEGGTVT